MSILSEVHPKPLKNFISELAKSVSYERTEFLTIPIMINLLLSTYYTQNRDRDRFKAKVSFADGVRKTMEWLKENV